MDSQLIVSQKLRPNLYGSKITVLSPAKINLYLNILGKYPDGFHEVESVIERISIFDKITVEITKDPAITISSNNKKLETENNLCARAARIIKNMYSIPYGFSISLTKNIPIGAGLGGGSSNAASTLLAVNQLLGFKLGSSALYLLGEKLGSDVNFFLSNSRFARVYERGQKVEPWKVDKSFSHFIVWPGIHLSTKEIYRATRVKLTNFFNNVKIIRYALDKGDVFLLNKSIFNILGQSAENVCRELKTVKSYLYKSKLSFVMTGSGSAFYSLPLSSSNRSNRVLCDLKNSMPKGWSVFYAQTC
jgi:4-diphosphocytidyl-2-C-methyl-D-erythritol kinase